MVLPYWGLIMGDAIPPIFERNGIIFRYLVEQWLLKYYVTNITNILVTLPTKDRKLEFIK